MPRIHALTAFLLSYSCMFLTVYGSTLSYEIYNQDSDDLQKVVGFRLLVPARSSPFINPYDTPIDTWVDNIPPAGQRHLFEIPFQHNLTGATIELYYLPDHLEAAFRETKDEQFLEQFKIWKTDTIKLDLPSSNPSLYKFNLTLRRDYEINFPNSRSVNDLFTLLEDTHNDLLLPSFIRKLLSCVPAGWWDRIFSYLLPDRESGAASGHNMATKAGEALLKWLVQTYPDLKEVSVSGNYCTDKKVSAVNGILGRGKNVTAEICLPAEICQKHLRASPQAIVDLNYKKNMVGSTLAGSLRSANAHYANILLALYLATGQDAANIIEGSQGITYASVTADGALQFSVNMPNIIVGVVGNGKHHDFVQKNLTSMACDPQAGQLSAQRLAIITAATVLCSELSLMAALTNSGELMHTHVVFERHSHIQDQQTGMGIKKDIRSQHQCTCNTCPSGKKPCSDRINHQAA